jgi:hypothetical protein
MLSRRRSTPQQTRESVRRAKTAFNTEYFRYREGMLGFRNSAEGVGDGGEDVGPTNQDGYTTTSADARKTRDHEPWADGGTEAEAGGYHMAETLRRDGYRKVMTAKSGHSVYEGPGGHRVWVKGGEAYSKNDEGGKIHFTNEAELEAGMRRRGKAAESVRTFFKRYLRG